MTQSFVPPRIESRAGIGATRAGPAEPKRLAILGATGSIGRSCAQVVAEARGRFAVVAVAGGRDGAALARSALELGASFAALADPAGYAELKAGVGASGVEIAAGPEAVVEAALREADLVVSAIVGAAGLAPTYAAISAGRAVALANKETLVCAGEAVMAAARRSGARLLPMDSEHNAIFQALGGRDPRDNRQNDPHRLGRPVPQLERRAHRQRPRAPRRSPIPTGRWAARSPSTPPSLMNKGLELIEAHHLFGVPAERLAVVVHPQSIVHGLVAFADGSLIAGLASPDMRTPIAHCLAYPERIASGAAAPDLAALGALTFEPADLARFPRLDWRSRRCARAGGAPTALNAANEIAVAAFLDGRIGFGGLSRIVERTLEAMRAAGETHARRRRLRRRWRFTISREIGRWPSWRNSAFPSL